MDRYLIAYLLIALLVVGLVAVIAGAIYYSRGRTLKRQMRAARILRERKAETKDEAP